MKPACHLALLQLSSADGTATVVETTDSSNSTTRCYDAAYIGQDGRQLTTSTNVGPTDLDSHATFTTALSFESAKPGGTLHISQQLDGQ